MDKKVLNISTFIAGIILVISLVLSIFNIGPTTEPIYMYINDSKISKAIIIIAMGLSMLMIFITLFLLINKRATSINQIAILLLLSSLSMDIVIGSNMMFSVASILNIIVLALNLRFNKKSKHV